MVGRRFRASRSQSTCVRLVLSSVAIVALEIFSSFMPWHGLDELPGNDLLDRLGVRLFEDILTFEEIIDA